MSSKFCGDNAGSDQWEQSEATKQHGLKSVVQMAVELHPGTEYEVHHWVHTSTLWMQSETHEWELIKMQKHSVVDWCEQKFSTAQSLLNFKKTTMDFLSFVLSFKNNMSHKLKSIIIF